MPIDMDERLMYWEFPGTQRAAIRGEWKAVSVKQGAPLELYRITADPNETTDLSKVYPEIVTELNQLMKVEHAVSPNFPE